MIIEGYIVYHGSEVKDVIGALQSDASTGLSEAEAKSRLKDFGANSIAEEKKRSWISILLVQFKSPIVYLLLIAAGLSGWFGEWMDALAIVIVLFINAGIGFYMEFQAERSMAALKKLSVVNVKALRDGRLVEINSECIVPGDIIFVEAGDMISADGRIISSSQLQVDESALTGESLPSEKNEHVLRPDTVLADRDNMLYKGTFVSKGNGYFVVTNTGMTTELGKVAKLVQSAEQSVTPLEQKLEEFSKKLIKITVALVVVIFVAGVLDGKKIVDMLETSIALAVAAIPEGLPIVATLALAQGMIRMARHNVIVKQLSSVETLGGTNIICTDKTGTLTKNQIEVAELIPLSLDAKEKMLQAMILCNTAEIYSKDNSEKELGDPLEIGLLKYTLKEGINIDQVRMAFPKKDEEPFSSETKIMSTLHKHDKGSIVFSKGAVEEILKRCVAISSGAGSIGITAEHKQEWIQKSERLAGSGLRVIATAYKENIDPKENLGESLIFAGLVGMIDPPREEVFPAINECRTAGIEVVMITGDHPATAQHISRQLNITDSPDAKVLLGKNLRDYETLTDSQKTEWANARVFARVSPKQKLDIVSVLQEKGNVVAMTGDGINDAPALKKADIGIAMGKRGTQVAQEVSDMILKDDSFTSIVLAIKQGRIIYENIRKFVIFLLSCNLSELLLISIASIFSLHFQLFPLQILFINLITDVLPALALGVTGGGKDVMNQPPRDAAEPIIDRSRWISIFVYSTIISLTSIGSVYISHYTIHKTETWNPELCNNILFMTLIFSQLLHVFNMNGSGSAFFTSEVMKSKYIWVSLIASSVILILCYMIEPVRRALSIYELTWMDWLVASAASLASLIIIQLYKLIFKK